ncbi:hypothetical protein QO005_002840 [Rhizobium paknamense]|uniref:Uncharacterized protein n=1 Tax=Rhizobium paknamense TaxID=1206817 RepID=A0ABU0IE30_9HYPH|nr:hypothetical protein [Rhizobium paknamense]
MATFWGLFSVSATFPLIMLHTTFARQVNSA